MNSIRTRYLLREFSMAFASLFCLLLLLFSIESFLRIAELLVQKAFSPVFVAKFFALSVSATVPYVVPVAFLCATTTVFTRLSLDREIIVLASSGVNPLVLVRPLAWTALAAALVLTYCNFTILPTAKLARKRLVREARVDNPVGLIQPRTIVRDIPGLTIYAEEKGRRSTFKGLRIMRSESNGRQTQVSAARGSIRYLPTTGSIVFSLSDGSLATSAGNDPRSLTVMRFSSYTFEVALPPEYRRPAIEPKLPEMGFARLRELLPQLDALVEVHRRLVYATAPLFLVLFGSGAGLRLKSTSRSVHIGVGVVASLAFFEMLTIGEVLAFRTGTPVFLWLPSGIFAAAGAGLRTR